MRFFDINKRYTEIINGYLAEGYIFNGSTMGGSQGEICSIDLTNGTEIIRVYMNDFSDYLENKEGVEIVVGRCTDDVKPNACTDRTVWISHLEVLSRERYYRLGRYHTDYFGTEADAKTAADRRRARYCNRDHAVETRIDDPKKLAIAKKIARTKLGVKRICNDDLKLFKSRKGYEVIYRDKSYRLH